ncbi:MAG: phosphoserine phosphatase SerB [Robiginitomaculum sp.]|nr:MAG: phosphoserine phosphatase SerB [Robiginitomaculum sp.]
MQTQEHHSLTLVLSKPDQNTLSALADLCANIDGLTVNQATILSKNKALDLRINLVPNLRKTIETLLAQNGIEADFCIQAVTGRKKQLLICDMDSTLIGQECIDELADFAGVKDRVSGITERAMRGELDFDAALKERVKLLKGLPLSKLQTCFEERIFLNTGAKTLCQTMRKNGAKTVIVSGGFTFFTGHIAQLAGFETHQANTLIDDGTHLTGDVGMPILGRDAKKSALDHHSAPFGGAQTAIAIGDGANDLAMIEAAGLGIAYYAKPIVADAAHCAINTTDLTTALYFQGYKDEDFVSEE